MGLQPNALYYGDCLEWMDRWDDGSVDLIYLDPPFNSHADYNILFGNTEGGAQYKAFSDIWTWDNAAADRLSQFRNAIARPARPAIVGLECMLGPSGMLSYLTYMAERLEHCHRLLKDTGSLWLHCDPTASHYLKPILDAIFGARGFRNEIVWGYTGPGSPGMRQFNRKHDTIFWFSKGDSWTFNKDAVRLEHDGKTKANFKKGLSGSGFADTPLRPGKVPESWWVQQKGNGLAIAARQKRQYLGYPTQKPVALLERIVKASSNPGDIVLDPFCGCGTTIAAARKLNRQWVGIDIDAFAIDIIRDRLSDPAIVAHGIPYDLAAARRLARERPFAFETWAVRRLAGFVPNTKQVADGGVDGRATIWEQPEGDLTKLALAQVKGGGFSLGSLRDFGHVIKRDSAGLGCYLTLDRIDTSGARNETARMGTVRVSGTSYPRMQRWSMAEYFDGLSPKLPLMADPYSGKPLQPRFI